MRLLDLSHPIVDGMITYPGLAAPRITPVFDHEASHAYYQAPTCFHIGKIEMVANTGTYLDAPFHRYPEGIDIGRLPLERLAHLPGRCFRTVEQATGAELFGGEDLRGKAVLVRTDWSRHWGSESYFQGHPYLTEEAARFLVAAGVALVGIDSLNIDATDGGHRPVHSVLLAAGIPVVEHLCGLEGLPEQGFRFSAVPAPVQGMGTFPVRAFALLEEE